MFTAKQYRAKAAAGSHGASERFETSEWRTRRRRCAQVAQKNLLSQPS
jgi:hypothetical protein